MISIHYETSHPSIALLIGLAVVGMLSVPLNAADDKIAWQIAIVLQAGPNGAGSDEARQACDELSPHGLEILPQLLTAMDTPNSVAANWLRTVADPLVERSFDDPQATWPIEFLKEYVSDAKRRARPREWALSILDRLEPKFRAEWLPTRLDDPAFRYDAVALTLAAGEKSLAEKQPEHAKSEFLKAFRHARDAGQVTQASTQLKSLGEEADVAQHLGLITDWKLIGPFDAPGKSGFETVFPPEKQLDLKARYTGQGGVEIRWAEFHTTDVLGTVNLNEALTACREAVGYAYTEIEVPADQPAQLRCGADDNCTIWLNGKKVFGRDQWLNGTRFDRFPAPVSLKAARNTLLVKICQGPQHRDPEVPNNWTFQLRVCDDDGLGVEFQVVK
jgi:hypothetical protein